MQVQESPLSVNDTLSENTSYTAVSCEVEETELKPQCAPNPLAGHEEGLSLQPVSCSAQGAP
jgi:hypothetical protein